MDIRRVAYYRQRECHLQKHQAEPHTQAYSQKIRIADGGLWVMDDRHCCNSQCMWPPRKGMEQTECHATCHTKQSYRMLDYPTDRLHAHLFWSLHHQVLPQYHISRKWHAGQDAGSLRRISRSWPRRTGLPIRQLAGRTIVEHTMTKTGTAEKKKRSATSPTHPLCITWLYTYIYTDNKVKLSVYPYMRMGIVTTTSHPIFSFHGIPFISLLFPHFVIQTAHLHVKAS